MRRWRWRWQRLSAPIFNDSHFARILILFNNKIYDRQSHLFYSLWSAKVRISATMAETLTLGVYLLYSKSNSRMHTHTHTLHLK